MAEITAGGYQTIKDYGNSSATTPASWDYIEVYDDSGSAVTRVSITGDSRANWADVDGDPTLKVEITLSGGDSDITTPITLEYSALWNASSGGTQITTKEQMATATLETSNDQTTITHVVEIPDQP